MEGFESYISGKICRSKTEWPRHSYYIIDTKQEVEEGEPWMWKSIGPREREREREGKEP